VKTEIEHAKWLVWHGKGAKSVARIKALDASLMPRKGYELSTLWWNLRRLYCYIDNNTGTLVNYGARYRKGLPISSSCRIRGESGGQPSHGEEAANAMD
jgi:hypothetical protein